MNMQRLAIPPSPPRQRMRWARAWKSLRTLLADPQKTESAVDLTYAIGRNDFERAFQRFTKSPRGRQLLERAPSLAEALSDSEALARMPEGSLGHAYLAYLDRNGYSATGLIGVERRVAERWRVEEGTPTLDRWRGWLRDRMIMTHDLSHVMTGYGTDAIGEGTLLAFNLAQTGGHSNTFLTLGAAFDLWGSVGRGWPAYLLAAYRRGRHALPLIELPWEDLLPLPLEAVREIAGVEAAERTHPGGIMARTLRQTTVH